MAMNPRLLRPLASGFSPRQIPGLAFWLDAADSATVTTVSGAVSEWRSKAGNGLAATQATAANRPAYTASGRNGKNVVTFDGAESSSGDSLVTSAISLAQPYTVFWAGRSNGRLPGVTPADAPYIFDGSTSGTRVAMVYNGSNVAASNGRLGIFAGTAVVEPTSGTQAYNEWGIVSAVFSGAASSLRSNSAEVATGSPGTNAMVALRLGTRYDEAATSTATFFEGPWGEFLIYNSILTASQRQRVEGYLAWKWGLQAQLPYDHPYARSFPGYGSQALPTDPDAQTYLAAVSAADGTGVEVGVANAVDSFVTGCKSDGIWDSIKASCILAGARTLAGALVPLRGSAPTNNNFVSGDYNRETGLKGNGTNKYLNSNRANDDDPQDDNHNAVWVATADSQVNARSYLDGGGTSSGANNIGRSGTVTELFIRSRCATAANPAAGTATGLIGTSRSGAAAYTLRVSGANSTITQASQTPDTSNIDVYSRAGSLVTDARLAFYSIGEALDLEALDTRVSALITAIGSAI